MIKKLTKLIKKSYRLDRKFVNCIEEQHNPIRDNSTFRLISQDGKENYLNKSYSPKELQILKKIYLNMLEIETIDTILLKSQRQGRISFYMTSTGEEGSIIGSAAGLDFNDMVMTQYREMGVFYWRGFTLKEITDSCVGNYLDCNKAHQMPIHFTAKKLNIFSVSSPLGTQISQSSGYGYGLSKKKSKSICVTYFGEGTASEGDFYAGLNFAQTLGSNTLFFCRNNQYAISTNVKEQTSGDGIISKARGLGIKSIRVDGNDPIAVYETTKYAREYILKNHKPFFIEAMTYRISDHSTSDHSVLYREREEIEYWNKYDNPKIRLKNYLISINEFDSDFEKEVEEKVKIVKKNLVKDLKISLNEKMPAFETLFDDVYYDIPEHLKQQKKDLYEHIDIYKDNYNLGKYQKDDK